MPRTTTSSAASLATSSSTSARLLVAVRVLAEHVAQPEHRPHRVADRVVELACLLAGAGHGSIVARSVAATLAAASCGRGDAGRDPDPVVRRAADREPGQPRPARARTEATRSRWPTAYCGQRATPPLHVACRPAGPRARSRRRGRARASSTSSSSLRWSSLLLAVPTERAAQHDHRFLGGAPASRTQSHLAKENVDAFTARPSTGGTRKPEPGHLGERRGRERPA